MTDEAGVATSTDGGVADGLSVSVTATVTEDQIDHLGHMNVAFYALHAHAGTVATLDGLGATLPGRSRALIFDAYTRHFREQLLGAHLELRTGLLDVGPETVTLYHELANRDSGALAATMVHRAELRDTATGAGVPVPTDLATLARAGRVRIPEDRGPRSLDLSVGTGDVELDELRRRRLAFTRPRHIGDPGTATSDAPSLMDLQLMVWGGDRVTDEDPLASANAEIVESGSPGWATMESRFVWHELPRMGQPVQTFAAELHVGEKIFHRRFWVFALDTESLLLTYDFLGLAFDPSTRRSTAFPAGMRADLEARLHPDLVGTPTTGGVG